MARGRQLLAQALEWQFPVGETPLFDLPAEQDAFDALLAGLPTGAALTEDTSYWRGRAEEALRRACTIQQSLRDHRQEYRARYTDARFRRSFSWYIWEFLNVVDRTSGPRGLGASGRF